MSISANKTLETESIHSEASGLDSLTSADALNLLFHGQLEAAKSTRRAIRDIEIAADRMVDCISAGGNLIYVGAGSSGLMALADGLELPGTFGIPKDRIHILFAGGIACLKDMKGGPEDDVDQARKDILATNVKPEDCAILVSASGRTPYTLEVAKIVREKGGTCIGLANNSSSPLLDMCDVSIFLPTPPELIAGSTRMGAGTAQKVALNMLSTMMGIQLGHVLNGMMVNLVADNHKLVERANRMLMSIAACSQDDAIHCLNKADGSVKKAVLLAAGAENVNQAQQLLSSNRGKLRAALLELSEKQSSNEQCTNGT